MMSSSQIKLAKLNRAVCIYLTVTLLIKYKTGTLMAVHSALVLCSQGNMMK